MTSTMMLILGLSLSRYGSIFDPAEEFTTNGIEVKSHLNRVSGLNICHNGRRRGHTPRRSRQHHVGHASSFVLLEDRSRQEHS